MSEDEPAPEIEPASPDGGRDAPAVEHRSFDEEERCQTDVRRSPRKS